MTPFRNFAAAAAVAVAALVPVSSSAPIVSSASAPIASSASAKEFGGEVRHIQASLFSGASPAALRKDLDTLFPRTDIITFTEVMTKARAKQLNEPGWTRVWSPGPGSKQNAIVVRDSVWTVERTKVKQLSPKTYVMRARGNASEPLHATSALLRHNFTGKTVMVTAAHMPSLIEGKKRLQQGDKRRAATYRSAMRGWKKHVNAWQRNHKPNAVIVTADWNLNLKKAWVRKWVKNRLPAGFAPNFKAPYPKGGTHEGSAIGYDRIIDFAYIRGLKLTSKTSILGDIRSSDHHPAQMTARFR